MLETGIEAQSFKLKGIDGSSISIDRDAAARARVLAFFSIDCPTCQLTMPYLQSLDDHLRPAGGGVIGISQDAAEATGRFLDQLGCEFPVALDEGLDVSRSYDPPSVPTLFLIDADFKITRQVVGFTKEGLNALDVESASLLGIEPKTIAPDHDGNPDAKPGCESRHLEPEVEGEEKEAAEGTDAADSPAAQIFVKRGPRASRVDLADGVDPYDACFENGFADPLPVVPPTVARVERMLAATDLAPDEVVALVPPNYGMATVEKIAANAVMAGCEPKAMRVLIPLIRAVSDEKFNIHGVQATTHFAAPLVLVNGPIREELGFASRSNVFSNVARTNSTVGRALQLILGNIGGARPGEIDMSTLGNPGKFGFCIAENEEDSPWEPFHVGRGLKAEQSALSLFACEAPHGVSEHNTRDGREVLDAFCYALRCVWTYRACMLFEAMVVIGPEHAKTLAASGLSKDNVRDYLFENTGIPEKDMDAAGTEGAGYAALVEKIEIGGEPHYRKFAVPDSIKIVVAGGTAGKFSAVLGSWLSGPRGSQMVTYPID